MKLKDILVILGAYAAWVLIMRQANRGTGRWTDHRTDYASLDDEHVIEPKDYEAGDIEKDNLLSMISK